MAKVRKTIQMQKIKEYVCSVRSHPNAEMVFEHVRKEIPSITLATVYRNLHKLADDGKILRFKVNNEYRFDCDRSSHVHFVCRCCGSIIDHNDKELCTKLSDVPNMRGFKVESVIMCVEGLCKKCSEKR
ncbi:MAG: transcriptional repressor [Candidatus Diapherotrites archaeon]|nr:transcriptional repressor [Candidatus Diapherotrites archaeon]